MKRDEQKFNTKNNLFAATILMQKGCKQRENTDISYL